MAENKKEFEMAFAAIDKTIIESIPRLIQDDNYRRDYIYYGEDNLYPEYLNGLYTDVSTLKTIIDGTSDYIVGDDVICNVPAFAVKVNRKGDTMRELLRWLSRDYMVYGGCSFEVIRNKVNGIAELNYIDFRYLRTDKKNQCFWYSEEFGKRYGRTGKAIIYPKFIQDSEEPASIVYIKNNVSTPYPIPRYSGAIKACEIERNIDEMHLSSLQNGFMGSYIINFANGIPNDEQKVEIEKNVRDKFCGSHNTGSILLNFSANKDNATTLEKLDITDFGEKYEAAAKRSREQIFGAFGVCPCVFGLTSEATGFSEIEFQEAFKLYNSTTIRSIQRTLIDVFDKVLNTKGSITIIPFTLGDNNNETDKTVS